MTLPMRGAAAAAERAIELVAAVEALEPDADEGELVGALGAVLERWDDPIDETFVQQIAAVRAVVVEIGRIVDVADADQAAAILNGWLARVASTPRLVDEVGWGWHLHLEPAGADWPTWLLASTAHALAVQLVEHGRLAWGRCAAAACGRPFVDRGRREPQRFCGTACATRERVRRHRARGY